MLGWEIQICTQSDGADPATEDTPKGHTLAWWVTGPSGLTFLEALVKSGSVVTLGGNGYPSRYTAKAEDILPILGKVLLEVQPGQIGLNEGFHPHAGTVLELVTSAGCRVGEWLLIEAWDQS